MLLLVLGQVGAALHPVAGEVVGALVHIVSSNLLVYSIYMLSIKAGHR